MDIKCVRRYNKNEHFVKINLKIVIKRTLLGWQRIKTIKKKKLDLAYQK